MLIDASEAANNDPEANQLMADWECTIVDGIEELERGEINCGVSIAAVFGEPPKK